MSAAARVNPEDFFTPEQWAKVSARSSWRGLALVAHCWLMIGAAMAMGVVWPVTIPLAVVLIGNRQLGLFILMHDAAHALLHRNRAVNDWVGKWLCGTDLAAYRPYHLQHHRFVQQTEDPDLVLSAPFPITRRSLYRKMIRDLTGQTFFKQRFGRLVDKLRSRKDKDSVWPILLVEVQQQRYFLIFNATGLALFSLAGLGWAWCLLWLLPMATWLPLISRLRNISEHALVAQNGTDPLRHARTTHANWLERLLIAPYWVNYHCEHHMFTQIACWNLPAAHRMLKRQGATARMEWQPGYISLLRAASARPAPPELRKPAAMSNTTRHKALTSFRPYLIDSMRGYSMQRLTKDVSAGATVGIVALPLAMAFAMASGLKPEAGIFTAIIAGFLISALGGSRVQIGGPAGAFIVIVYGIVERYGLANLIIATAMSGVMLFLMGFFKLGSLIRFVPVAVVIGFTNGIAVLVAVAQFKDFLGLQVPVMPANFFGILSTVWAYRGTTNFLALALALLALFLILAWQVFMPKIARGKPGADGYRDGPQRKGAAWAGRLSAVPGSIVALVVTTLLVTLLDMKVDTIGSRFGGIPSALPGFAWPDFSWETARFLIVPATTLALLGAIESLLCARVADGMIDDRHNSNQELMAQGIANFITPFFGGMPATGTIARTMTNVKSGATSPIAGIVHAVVLLVVILVAAPLANNVPLAALSAILLFVAWNMGEWREFANLRQFRVPYRVTLLAVFFLTVVFDLTVAVEVGLIAACVTFIYRISSLSRSERVHSDTHRVLAGFAGQVDAYRLYGALFFGAVKLLEDIADDLPSHALVLDLKNVIYMDSSGVDALTDLIRACQKSSVRLLVCGLMHQPLDIAKRTGLKVLLDDSQWLPDLASGLAAAVKPA